MTTVSHDSREEDWDDDETDEQLPRRPRRQFFNRRTASLAALVMCAAGFYAGVRVEKGQLSSSTSASSGFSLSAARAGAGSGPATGNAPGRGARGAFAGLPGSGNASFGTVSSIDGKTIYVSDTSGNTVKIRLSSATKISKSLRVSKKSVRPGDTVVIQGLKNRATLIATSVSDSGAGGTAGSTSGNGSSSSGSSAVGSLFSASGAGGAGGG